MRDALDLDVVALYLPEPDGRPACSVSSRPARRGARCGPRDDCRSTTRPGGWRSQAARRSSSASEASWLVANPFEPRGASWLVLPLVAEARLVGVVVAAAARPLSLDPTAATVLSLLGDLLAAGIATARLRQELQERRSNVSASGWPAEIHDGLAQDLALAMRELALLESGPAARDRPRERGAAPGGGGVGAPGRARAARGPLGPRCPWAVSGRRRGVSAHAATGLPLTSCGPGTRARRVARDHRCRHPGATEALANVARHAHPDRVEVRLLVDDERLTLGIEDDGVGFQPADVGGPGDGHFGLTLMHERARSAGGRLRYARRRRGHSRDARGARMKDRSNIVSPVLSGALAPALDSGACPHLAVLLRSEEEFAPVVASFYSLGASRGGWLVHRGVEPERDREALAGAGLDVSGLEAERRLALELISMEEPPEQLPRRLDAGFDEALERGLTTLWSSHTPVAPDSDSFAHAMEVERAWEEHFRDRPVVTLCPYVVAGSTRPQRSGGSPASARATTPCSCPPTTASSCSGRVEPPATGDLKNLRGRPPPTAR